MTNMPATRMPTKPLVLAFLLALVALLVVSPSGFGLSTGANKDTIQDANFAAKGCTACHGGGKFAAGGPELVHYSIVDATGAGLAGNTYAKDGKYTISITFDEMNALDGGATGHHAGFNLRASGGKLDPVAGISQVSKDQTQATHIDASRTNWTVLWTPPTDDSVVSFTLFVNDVDGSGQPDAGDQVHRLDFYLTNSKGDVAGAVKTEVKEFGISLQQYWIGLIGLAGMIFVMVAGYVFLKYGSSHNTDAKDR